VAGRECKQEGEDKHPRPGALEREKEGGEPTQWLLQDQLLTRRGNEKFKKWSYGGERNSKE